MINKKLPELNPDSKWELSTELMLGLMAIQEVAGVGTLLFTLWRLGKLKAVYRAIKPLGRVICGKSGKGDMHELQSIISSIQSYKSPGTPPLGSGTVQRHMPTAPQPVETSRALTLGEDSLPLAVLLQITDTTTTAPKPSEITTTTSAAGLYTEMPMSYCGRVVSKINLAVRHKIHVSAGTIDPDYHGEIGVLLVNLLDKAYHFTQTK